MARTKRAQRAAEVARAAPKGSAKQKAAHAVIRAEKEAQKVAKTGGLAALREERTEAMETRAERFKGRKKITDKPAKSAPTLADTIAAANEARAYADAMRRMTGREKGVGTPYTGGGIELDEGGDIREGILDQFRDERFMGDVTSAQMKNIKDMLEYGDEESVRDRRATWREEVWDDTWNPDTGMWDKGDRTAALARQEEYLKQPLTYEQFLSGNYPLNLGNQLNRKQGTSAFQHPYAADPYTVPHMQTGGLWEGLGAEYQPGTVEGLGLLAGEPSAPYEPLAKSMLDASPAYMPQTSGLLGKDWTMGLAGGTGDTNTNTNTNNNTTPITWGYKWYPNPAGTSDVWEGQGKATVGGKQGTWSWGQTSGAGTRP